MSTTTDIVARNELFVRNMRCLWRLDARSALAVDAIHDDDRYAVEPTRNGDWTVRATASLLEKEGVVPQGLSRTHRGDLPWLLSHAIGSEVSSFRPPYVPLP